MGTLHTNVSWNPINNCVNYLMEICLIQEDLNFNDALLKYIVEAILFPWNYFFEVIVGH